MPYKLYTAVLLLAAASFSATAISASTPSIGNLINERLSLMKDVAGYKGNITRRLKIYSKRRRFWRAPLLMLIRWD